MGEPTRDGRAERSLGDQNLRHERGQALEDSGWRYIPKYSLVRDPVCGARVLFIGSLRVSASH